MADVTSAPPAHPHPAPPNPQRIYRVFLEGSLVGFDHKAERFDVTHSGALLLHVDGFRPVKCWAHGEWRSIEELPEEYAGDVWEAP